MSQYKFAGFSLIELLVVIAIFGILSVFTVTNYINFQKDSRLYSFAEEFASVLKTAKNKSVNGELPAGVPGFENYSADDSLPFWLVEVNSGNYQIYSKYKLSTDADFTSSTAETYSLGTGYSILPETTVEFERLSGKTTVNDFTLMIDGITETVTVAVSSEGNTQVIND